MFEKRMSTAVLNTDLVKQNLEKDCGTNIDGGGSPIDLLVLFQHSYMEQIDVDQLQNLLLTQGTQAVQAGAQPPARRCRRADRVPSGGRRGTLLLLLLL